VRKGDLRIRAVERLTTAVTSVPSPSSSGESRFHLVGFDLKHILEELKGLLGGFRETVWVEGRFLVQSREESGSHLSGA
jgi:hypothetical protein